MPKQIPKNDEFVKSTLHKWIIYHAHVIRSLIKNDYIKLNLDVVNQVLKTELCQKVLPLVYVHELCIDILNKYSNGIITCLFH